MPLILPASTVHNYTNGNITRAYEYVRQTTNSNSPITDVTSKDMICRQGGLDSDIMAKTSTYTVASGDEVSFTTNSNIGYPGPLSAASVSGRINNFTFTLPNDLPAGNYLMRAEHIALYGASTFGGAQFYIGCAQLSPSPAANIPGVYTGNEAGILINIYWPIPTNYTATGIATRSGSYVDHTANFVDQTSDGDCTNDDGAGSSSSSTTSSNCRGSDDS
ncbi:hypothetical protein GQ53DRAFT_778655 [Thozetella sp. PMI_491]|nr:hypothetical protein GQ53DRAFT_778655 [Thozetella sp. PMI_491]